MIHNQKIIFVETHTDYDLKKYYERKLFTKTKAAIINSEGTSLETIDGECWTEWRRTEVEKMKSRWYDFIINSFDECKEKATLVTYFGAPNRKYTTSRKGGQGAKPPFDGFRCRGCITSLRITSLRNSGGSNIPDSEEPTFFPFIEGVVHSRTTEPMTINSSMAIPNSSASQNSSSLLKNVTESRHIATLTKDVMSEDKVTMKVFKDSNTDDNDYDDSDDDISRPPKKKIKNVPSVLKQVGKSSASSNTPASLKSVPKKNSSSSSTSSGLREHGESSLSPGERENEEVEASLQTSSTAPTNAPPPPPPPQKSSSSAQANNALETFKYDLKYKIRDVCVSTTSEDNIRVFVNVEVVIKDVTSRLSVFFDPVFSNSLQKLTLVLATQIARYIQNEDICLNDSVLKKHYIRIYIKAAVYLVRAFFVKDSELRDKLLCKKQSIRYFAISVENGADASSHNPRIAKVFQEIHLPRIIDLLKSYKINPYNNIKDSQATFEIHAVLNNM
jgi:hypothetical protein